MPDKRQNGRQAVPGVTEAIVDTIGCPILVLEKDGTVALANQAFYDGFVMREEDTVGHRLPDLGNGQWAISELRDLLDGLHDAGGTLRDYRVEHDFEQIGRRVMLLTASLLKQQGSERILLVIDDVTQSEKRDQELLAEKEFADKLIDSIKEGLVVLTRELTVEQVNESFCTMFGIAPDEAVGRQIYELGNGQWDIPALRTALGEILPAQHSFDDFEVAHDFPDIGRKVMLLNARQLDHLPRILLAIRDQTERHALGESQALMVGELQHRVKNILAIVRSVATATIRRSGDLEGFRAAYLPRLDSMARTQDLLLSGAEGAADLRDIMDAELAVHGWAEDGRVSLEGPKAVLMRNQAQTFAMVIHELATNAVKYGAFSDPAGRLDVEWTVSADGDLDLEWRESGLDALEPPVRKGFGSEMIERSVEYSLKGRSELDFRAGGLVCRLAFPLVLDPEIPA